jgi:hypothetical protein
METEKTGNKQGKRFQKGQSGNPAGRPKGALNQTTLACQALLDGEAEAITRKAVEIALGGDLTAIRLCMDRLLPPRKERPVSIDLPMMGKYSDMAKFTEAILEAVKSGILTIGEAQGIVEIAKTQIHYMPVSGWTPGEW